MTEQQRIEETLEIFRAHIKSRGHQMTPDERIREKTAADLVGVAPKTLRTMRAGLQGPAFIKIAGTVWYRLNDIARYVENGRYETIETALRSK